MNCKNCKKSVHENEFCLCGSCRETHCVKCAQNAEFVCECGGDIAYLP